LGENRAPACRSAWEKSGTVGKKGPVSERTVVLFTFEATTAGRKSSKIGSEITQIQRGDLPWSRHSSVSAARSVNCGRTDKILTD
jgi:hypothetical protein